MYIIFRFLRYAPSNVHIELKLCLIYIYINYNSYYDYEEIRMSKIDRNWENSNTKAQVLQYFKNGERLHNFGMTIIDRFITKAICNI